MHAGEIVELVDADALTHVERRIVALPCAPVWRTDEGMSLAGPEAFGCDLADTPVEELVGGG